MKLQSGVRQKTRRERALKRLEQQLESGVKNVKVDNKQVSEKLSENDIKRIRSEIETLSKRV